MIIDISVNNNRRIKRNKYLFLLIVSMELFIIVEFSGKELNLILCFFNEL